MDASSVRAMLRALGHYFFAEAYRQGQIIQPGRESVRDNGFRLVIEVAEDFDLSRLSDVERAAYDALDETPRTLADILRRSGYTSKNYVAEALRSLVSYGLAVVNDGRYRLA
jgi:hypothetical protein